jgi:hypothetical protein
VLVLDVYLVKVPSDVVQEKGFAFWAKSLKASGESSHEHAPVIHAIYRLGAAVNIDRHYKTGEGSEEQISVVGRVEPEHGAWNTRWNFRNSDGHPPTMGRRRQRSAQERNEYWYCRRWSLGSARGCKQW